MYYLLQAGLFKSHHEEKLVRALERLKLEYEWVKFVPFVHDIEFKTDRKDVMCFGSTMFSNAAVKYNWFPGSFYNENHDYEIYSKYYKDYLLNYDSKILSLIDKVDFKDQELFIRPCKDSKIFNGKLFNEHDWKDTIDVISTNWPEKLNDKIQISNPKTIYQEHRCWIVQGECVTISQYKLGNQVFYQNEDHNEAILSFVNRMLMIYQPAPAFVMDICFTESGMKIVEINNLNAAGFYDSNLQKLIMSLEHNFGIDK